MHVCDPLFGERTPLLMLLFFRTWTLFYFITYLLQLNIHFLVVGTWATISGIAFTLITVRIGLGWNTPTDSTGTVNMSQPLRFCARSAISTTGTQSITMHQVIDVSVDGDENPMSGMKRGILTYSNDVTAVA